MLKLAYMSDFRVCGLLQQMICQLQLKSLDRMVTRTLCSWI